MLIKKKNNYLTDRRRGSLIFSLREKGPIHAAEREMLECAYYTLEEYGFANKNLLRFF